MREKEMRKSSFSLVLWNKWLGLVNPQYICLQIEIQCLVFALYSGVSFMASHDIL